MESFNFYLKDKKATSTPIRIVFSWNRQRLVYSAKESINPKYWSAKNHKAKLVNDFPEAYRLNDRLEVIRTAAKEVLNRLKKADATIGKDKLKREMDIELKRISSSSAPLNLIPFIDYVVKQRTGSINPKNNRLYSLSTMLKYKNVRDLLQEIKPDIDFDDVTPDLYNAIVKNLTSKGYKINGLGKYIQTLKALMNIAIDYDVTTNIKFRKFAVLNEDVNDPYLNPKELHQLYNLDLSENKRFERVRDLFIVGCWTGLRFSDFTTLTSDNITEDQMLEVKAYKTNDWVMVPIHPTTKAIFEKYDFNFPKPISNQKFNEYLKDICKLARIDAAHTKKRTIGGIETDETAPKYEFISSHTARRSFATNLYNADFPTLDIMKITGHKTEKAFMRYIKITKKDAAQKLARRWAHDEQTIKMYG